MLMRVGFQVYDLSILFIYATIMRPTTCFDTEFSHSLDTEILLNIDHTKVEVMFGVPIAARFSKAEDKGIM